jgi:translation elongation factor EF-Tu-like GTPase
MPKKAGEKNQTKKAASRKTAKKKNLVKKSPPRKKALKKKAAKKKALKKKTAKKPAIKKAAKKAAPSRNQEAPPQPLMVEPGPPPRPLPPLEEPATNEVAIGMITHYYSHLSVAVAQLIKGELKTGDTIRIKGHSTDFTQTVESMEYEHQHVDAAAAGQSVGIKIKDHAREHDIVYLVK